MMVPCIAFLALRIWTRKKDYQLYHINEQYSSYWDAVNLFDINPYQKRPHIEKINESLAKKGLEKIKQDNWDHFYKFFLFTCILYYVADCFIKIYEMRFSNEWLDVCKSGYFFHHIATIFGFKSVFMSDHYPWFLAGPMCYHTVIVTFPKLGMVNNVIYLFFVASFMIYSMTPPFS